MQKFIGNFELIPDLVSIIVPVYNAEKYISKCIESVIAQNHTNIELLIINDGSMDNTGEICDRYAFKDNRIKIEYIPNSGPAVARNKGIQKSKGEFIFFLDADDYVESKAISHLINCYRQSQNDLIIGDFNKIKNGIIEPRMDIPFSSTLLNKKNMIDYARLYLRKPNKYLLFAYSWGRLFKSSIIKLNNVFFDESLHTFEDVAFNFDYLRYVQKIYFSKTIIYNHTIHQNYVSETMAINNNPEKLFGFIKAFDSIRTFLNGNVFTKTIEEEIGHTHVTLVIIQLIRICGQINSVNKKILKHFVRELVEDSVLRNNIKFYKPSEKDSKLLPFLIRFGFVWIIILISYYKAKRRYK